MNIYKPRRIHSFIRHKLVSFSKVRRDSISFGFFAVKSMNFGLVTPRQLEAGRKFLIRNLTRKSKLWRLVTVTQPLTAKSKLSRMGKGKGKFSGWLGYVKPGTSLYELGYFLQYSKKKKKLNFNKLEKVSNKFPFQLQIISRNYILSREAICKNLLWTKV